MTVRRVDAWQVKPGQDEAFKGEIRAFVKAIETHNAGPVTLVRESSGGPTTGAYYAFADWDSMESYGAFIDAATQDEAVGKAYGALFAEDSPAIPLGSVQQAKLASFGAPEPINQPGAAGIVRIFAIQPFGHASLVETIETMADLYSHTNGHFMVWDFVAAGDGGPRALSAVVFPNMAELGAYLDDTRKNPKVAETVKKFMASAPAPRPLSSSILRGIAYE